MKSYNIRNYVFIALFAALFVVMSAISFKLSFSPVPITLQTLAVCLAGLFLGARNGFLSMLLILVLTAIGLPLLNGRGGLSILFGTTGGFLFGFLFSALLIGLATGPLLRSKTWIGGKIATFILLFIIMEALGSFVAYLFGVPWMMQVLDVSLQKALTLGCYPFLIGDALKSLVAAAIGVSLKPYILKLRASTGALPVRSETGVASHP
ncbi:biotin transporter BioY [Paenibacillus thailandensis]|uniref:Biotin transporter n=1 Tax=Paenibacillus thailandensis TaxID=393250 RepID=A0ABW5QXN5_9BACL